MIFRVGKTYVIASELSTCKILLGIHYIYHELVLISSLFSLDIYEYNYAA